MADAKEVAFLTNFGLIALGCALRNSGCLGEAEGRAGLRVAIHVTLPALIFQTFTSPSSGRTTPGTLLFAPVCAAVGYLAAILGSWAVFRARKPDALRTQLIGMSSGLNIGIFAFPIIESIYGEAGLQVAAMFDTMNILVACGYAPAVFAALSDSSGAPPREILAHAVWKLLTFPPLLGLWMGLGVRTSGVETPAALAEFISQLATSNKVVALLGLGVLLQPRFNAGQLKALTMLVCFRCGMMLAIGALVAAIGGFLGVSADIIAVIVMCFCCPIPLLYVQYSNEFHCDGDLAAAMVNASNVVSLALMFGVAALPPRILPACLAGGAGVSLACAYVAGSRPLPQAAEDAEAGQPLRRLPEPYLPLKAVQEPQLHVDGSESCNEVNV